MYTSTRACSCPPPVLRLVGGQTVTVGDGVVLSLIVDRSSTPPRYHGIGEVTIDGVAVRSGRLPWHVKTQTFNGPASWQPDTPASQDRFRSLEILTQELLSVEGNGTDVVKINTRCAVQWWLSALS